MPTKRSHREEHHWQEKVHIIEATAEEVARASTRCHPQETTNAAAATTCPKRKHCCTTTSSTLCCSKPRVDPQPSRTNNDNNDWATWHTSVLTSFVAQPSLEQQQQSPSASQDLLQLQQQQPADWVVHAFEQASLRAQQHACHLVQHEVARVHAQFQDWIGLQQQEQQDVKEEEEEKHDDPVTNQPNNSRYKDPSTSCSGRKRRRLLNHPSTLYHSSLPVPHNHNDDNDETNEDWLWHQARRSQRMMDLVSTLQQVHGRLLDELAACADDAEVRPSTVGSGSSLPLPRGVPQGSVCKNHDSTNKKGDKTSCS